MTSEKQKEKLTTRVIVLSGVALCAAIVCLTLKPQETSADEGRLSSSVLEDVSSSAIESDLSEVSSDSISVENYRPQENKAQTGILDEDEFISDSQSVEVLVSSGSDDSSSADDVGDTDIDVEVEVEEEFPEDTFTYSSGVVLDVPNWDFACDSNRKLYMAYTAVTDTSSAQYDLLYNHAWTTPEGLRAVGDRYCIALGSYYTTRIGQKVDLILEDGSVIKCILGDCKADIHTNETNQYNWGTGNVAEFIVDNSVYSYVCDPSGTVNWISGLDGEIINIVLVD